MPFCPKCGTAVATKAEKCPTCSTALRIANTDGRTVSIVFVLVFGFAVFVYLAGSPTPSTSPLSKEDISTAANDNIQVKTDAAYVRASSDTVCSKRYPNDYSMRAACVRNADSGLADFVDIWNRHLQNGSMNIALQDCFNRYTEQDATDFSMAGACARNQEDGFREVK